MEDRREQERALTRLNAEIQEIAAREKVLRDETDKVAAKIVSVKEMLARGQVLMDEVGKGLGDIKVSRERNGENIEIN